jgi:hypothetical protein
MSSPPPARSSARPRHPAKETIMSREVVRPYLVQKHEDGDYRVTVRSTRFNSQGYPIVSSELLTDVFKTQAAAKSYVREQYRAESTDIATK